MFRMAMAALLLSAQALGAAQCGFQQCWGAVGIGPRGEWAWATGYVAELGALAKVRNACPGCTEIEAFFNGCGAIAVAPGGGWGFGWGETPVRAERAAHQYCASFGAGCRTAVWSCSH
jgi:serine/threonine-protein kinase